MSVIVYCAKEDELLVYAPQTEHLVLIKNTREPDSIPKTGLLELAKINGIRVSEEGVLGVVCQVLSGTLRLTPMGRICRELDTVHEDEMETHLILGEEDEELVETLDLINEEGLYAIGSYTYHTEFNKLFYTE